jgi:hypothetical protein
MENDFKLDTWSLEDIFDSKLINPLKKRQIVVPSFQRQRAWDSINETKYIDTVKYRRPNGILTLFKCTKPNSQYEEYILVDGLQRYITLIKYIEDPLGFENVFRKIKEYEKQITDDFDLEETIADEIISGWFSKDNFKNYQEIIKRKYAKKYDELSEKLIKYKFGKDKCKSIKEFIISKSDDFTDQIDLSNSKIAVSMYDYRNSSEIYEAFVGLNTNFIKLKTHEIYAAAWYKYEFIKIKDKEIVSRIEKHYVQKKENIQNLEISLINNQKKNEYTYFEYITGLKMLIEEKSKLLKKVSNDNYIYNLLSFCLFKDIQPENIVEKLKSEFDKDQFKTFQAKLLNAIQLIENAFDEYKLMKDILSIQQLSIMIATYYHKQGNPHKHYKEQLQIHLLNDKIMKKWVPYKAATVLKYIKNETYCKNLQEKEINKMFEQYALQNKQKSIAKKPQSNDRLFLNMVYFKVLSYNFVKSNELHIEHIIPMHFIKNICKNNEIVLASSHIGNLCMLDKDTNIDKGAKAFSQYINIFGKNGNAKKETFEKDYLFVPMTDLKIIDKANFKEDDYMNFVTKRYNILKQKFMDNYKTIVDKNLIDVEDSDGDVSSDEIDEVEIEENDDDNNSDNPNENDDNQDDEITEEEIEPKTVINRRTVKVKAMPAKKPNATKSY